MHPFRKAVETRDHGALEALLADDVVFTSPVAFKPYPGKATTAAVPRFASASDAVAPPVPPFAMGTIPVNETVAFVRVALRATEPRARSAIRQIMAVSTGAVKPRLQDRCVIVGIGRISTLPRRYSTR